MRGVPEGMTLATHAISTLRIIFQVGIVNEN
jgi:hypothetical protein